ncbi:MAG: hypothetical protein ACYTG0_29180 [Planctomycetota bacterium]|jgi:hypothetical protein
MTRTRRLGLVLLALALLAVIPAQAASAAAPAPGAAMIRVHLPAKSKTPLEGTITLSEGRVVNLAMSPAAAGSAKGNTWRLKATGQGTAKRAQRRAGPAELLITLDAPATARLSVATSLGDFAFPLADLDLGSRRAFLDGALEVESVPATSRLTTGPDEEDLPAAVQSRDGTVWVAYVAYRHGQPLDVEAIHQRREFGPLVPTGHGDQVRLMRFSSGAAGDPLEVTGPGLDVWRPAVAVDGQGNVVVIWSQNDDGNWDLYTRTYQPDENRWTGTRRLTTDPGADVFPVAAAHPATGAVHVVWQGWRGGDFDILRTTVGESSASSEAVVSDAPAGQWCPAAVFDARGVFHVAFDTYERGNYDVKLISGVGGAEPRTVDVAASPRFEARPSLAADKTGRLWIAYEDAEANWGKDFGTRWMGPSGVGFYIRRGIAVRCVEGNQVKQAAGTVPCDPVKQTYPPGELRRVSIPRLLADDAGRLWLLCRRHRRAGGGGEIWSSFTTYHQGEDWSTPVRLAHSENLLDNRPALLAPAGGGLMAIHSSDGRTGGTQSAKNNDLYCTVARVDGEVQSPRLVAANVEGEPAAVVHPNEAEDIGRMRGYRATIGGKTYRLLRGEFHRHTELTSHRDQDGPLEEIWRYGLDVAAMDWLGNGDHDNGYGVEYLWWMVQKQTDVFHHPPTFIPMFTYERSVVYPSGHRNAMFSYRGVRPLPRIPGGKEPLFGTPEEGSPDIKTFFAYLKHFDGICASHTSGTNMGTDWRDHDNEVEPVVEIYQGHRQNYEHEGAPGSAKNAQDSIGGYQPAGFVWNALKKGYRLGFQVSSDHVSTHLSYAVVYVEDTSREAILDAFKRRHCYGANDNVILDVRCGDRMMGDQFTHRGPPQLDVMAVGTQPIARLSIIRGAGDGMPLYVYDAEPNAREVKLRWTDRAPEWGKVNYYYVRIEQTRPADGAGALAWASPMWIEVER